MRKIIILLLLFLFPLTACGSSTYTIISKQPVDGYDIYMEESNGIFCNTEWQDVYYSGEVYNYGFQWTDCSPDMSFFILYNGEYVYLQYALEREIITLESLIPELQELVREPEEIESDKADYYWLDFHIGDEVVYAYAGGECDQFGVEEFVINDTTYTYGASGCLKEHILYMRIDGDEIPVADLIRDSIIDPNLLIPLLQETN